MSQFPEITSNLSTANWRASVLTMLKGLSDSSYSDAVKIIGTSPTGTAIPVQTDAQGVLSINPAKRDKDVLGRLKVSVHQNVYEADFEYGKQPLRWDEIVIPAVNGGGSNITHLPAYGGVAMTISAVAGDVTIRQSRPYHRYQPGKTMFMATALNFGTTNLGQFQRVGFFDDANGVFFQQTGAQGANPANPYGMSVVYRSDVPSNGSLVIGSTPADVVVDYAQWSDPQNIKSSINWADIQMYWIEFAWYGAGAVRWGVFLNGEPYILHEVGFGNNAASSVTLGSPLSNGSNVPQYASTAAGQQQLPWARTGNLPVRYEQRNITSTTANTMFHYGVSVVVEGKRDDQRGFTYAYGMSPSVPRRYVSPNTTRYPVISVQGRAMGTQEYQSTTTSAGAVVSALYDSAATWTTNQWVGRCVNIQGISLGSISAATSVASTYPNNSLPYIGTITFATAHNLSSGNQITISGATPTAWNGTWAVTSVPSSTQVTINLTSNAGTMTGFGTATYNLTARVNANTATTLTLQDIVTGLPIGAVVSGNAGTLIIPSGKSYTIGQINRGQLLPQTLLVSSDSLTIVELIASTPYNPVTLTGSSFTPLSQLGSYQSFGTRDVSATALSGGEVVYAFTTPAGGSGLQTIDLSAFFPLYNTIRGNAPDILTLAISTKASTQPMPLVTSATISGTTGTITFAQPHGLNVNDLITLTGFTPSGWNLSNVPVVSTPNANTITITIATGTPATATAQGSITAQIGANVGAHLVVQEAMS